MIHEHYCGCVTDNFQSEGRSVRVPVRRCMEAQSLIEERQRSNIKEYRDVMDRLLVEHFDTELIA